MTSKSSKSFAQRPKLRKQTLSTCTISGQVFVYCFMELDFLFFIGFWNFSRKLFRKFSKIFSKTCCSFHSFNFFKNGSRRCHFFYRKTVKTGLSLRVFGRLMICPKKKPPERCHAVLCEKRKGLIYAASFAFRGEPRVGERRRR